MKRWMMVFGLAGMMAAVVIAAEVRSVNTVGFKRIDIPAKGQAIIGIPFDAFDQTLMGVFGTNQLRMGNKFTPAPADQVWVWNRERVPAPGYDVYALNALDKQYHRVTDWGGPATNPPLRAGDAVYVRLNTNPVGISITLMGEVVDVTTQFMKMAQGATLMTYPFSADITLGQTDFAKDGAIMGTKFSPSGADQVWLWNGSNGFDVFALKKLDTNWYRVTDWSGPNMNGTVLEMGKGFWFRTTNATTWWWSETNRYLGNL